MRRTSFSLLFILCNLSFAAAQGDGTQQNPYTVSQLNAQKEALAATGQAVWVKADLQGLGTDGTLTDNANTTDGDGKTVHQMAALFGDGDATFTAYSWQILGELSLDEITNAKDLLICLTYGTTVHPYGNTSYPEYASTDEPTDPHFSLVEMRGALTLDIGDGGLRGYHNHACYLIPANVIAVKVSAGYTQKTGLGYVNSTNFGGAEHSYSTYKNASLVLMAMPGKYDLTLTTQLYEQTMSNGNALNPGTQAGLNTASTPNRARYRFVGGDRPGFERNSQDNCAVMLEDKDEVFLQVNSLETNFYGHYDFETADKNWISWGGGHYGDYHDAVQPGVEGDVNGDGTVDVADISAIISIMAGTGGRSFIAAADVNGDGTVDVADISNVITIMASN